MFETALTGMAFLIILLPMMSIFGLSFSNFVKKIHPVLPLAESDTWDSDLTQRKMQSLGRRSFSGQADKVFALSETDLVTKLKHTAWK